MESRLPIAVRGDDPRPLLGALRERGFRVVDPDEAELVVITLRSGQRLEQRVVDEEAARSVGVSARGYRPPGVVEVVSTPLTCVESIARVRELVRRLGLEPVRRADRGVSILDRLERAAPDETVDPVDRAVAAARLVDEGLCSRADVETAARVGLRWSKSPFAPLRSDRGPRELQEEILRRGLRPPFLLRRQAASSTPFDSPDLGRQADASAITLTLQRPATLNALDPSLLQSLEEAVEDSLEQAGDRRLRLLARGRAFLAGVDSAWILSRMEENDLESVLDLVRRGQSLFRRLTESPTPVEVEVDGLAAGAGVELLGWADRVVATAQARFVMPETSIGITPALGGTQRLPLRVGRPLARWMLLTGDFVSAGRARSMGLADDAPFQDDRGLEEMAALFDPEHSLEELLQPTPAFEDWAGERFDLDREQWRWVRRAHDQLLHRAPLALARTDRLVSESAGMGPEEGLAAELAILPEIFRSQDALRGVRAAAEGRRARRFAGD